MQIPPQFLAILEKNQILHSIVLDTISSFEPIFRDNKLFFFDEYTDHGITHIESVLKSAAFIISDESYDILSPSEVATLILSIVAHDIGMHLEFSAFKSMLDGEYDSVLIEAIDTKTWSVLWNDYLTEAKRFSSAQRKAIFGDEHISFQNPNLTNKDFLTGYDKKLIGEFIRRHHARLSHEIVFKGIIGSNSLAVNFGNDKLELTQKQLIGILARSHGINIRDTFGYLEDIAHQGWRNPGDVNIIFLMVVIRIADYIQIDSARVNPILLKTKTFNSPISKKEHDAHLAIESMSFNQPDQERIYLLCKPENAEMYVKLSTLINDIQKEFDISWAILGEIYGFIPVDKPSIKFRRISSNLEDSRYLAKLSFVPSQISFKVDNSLSQLLVAPLYGNNPTFGVRELIQNAIDACIERRELEYKESNFLYSPEITVSINILDDEWSIFEIIDNGKGMSETEIVNFFLQVGSSLRRSLSWKKDFVDDEGKSKINRNGKFGIGVLASFLLGNSIEISTTHFKEKIRYSFEAEIDSEFIEIKKEKSETKVGTTIRIKISNEKRAYCLNLPDEQGRRKHSFPDWTSWYIYDDPSIQFILDGQPYKKISKFEPVGFYSFSTDEFQKIEWKYVKSRNVIISKVVCNGIVITDSLNYDKSQFVYQKPSTDGWMYGQSGFVIKEKPSLLITDKNGIFPVKLDRNDVEGSQFSFDKPLLREISKKFIADILTLKIDPKNITTVDIHHSANLLYNAKGYTLNFDYFISGVKNDFRFVRILSSRSNLSERFLQYKNILILPEFEEKIKLSYQEGKVGPAYGARILLSKENYANLFESSTKRLPKYITNFRSVEHRDQNYVIYNLDSYKDSPVILEGKICEEENLLNDIESIQELDFEYLGKRGGEILNDLLGKYIKNNYLIPYDIKKRKAMYKEAFNDLSDFMNQ